MPKHTQALISRSAWRIPPIFQCLQALGNVAESEMFNVFNMGIGMILCVPPNVAERVQTACSTPEHPAMYLGKVQEQIADDPTVMIL